VVQTRTFVHTFCFDTIVGIAGSPELAFELCSFHDEGYDLLYLGLWDVDCDEKLEAVVSDSCAVVRLSLPCDTVDGEDMAKVMLGCYSMAQGDHRCNQ
jgi:hypothetical protein